MPQDSATELVNFVYGVFGEQCAAVLLAGLGEEPAQAGKKFSVREADEGGGREWEIEVVADAPPCRSEPLVLAALLRILLGREGVPSPLEFQTGEILDELLSAGVAFPPDDVDRILSKYGSLFYDKRAKGGDESDEGGGGMYSLVVAYFRGSVSAGGMSLARLSNSVHFDHDFVAGLRRGEVVFAGIRFGRLGRNPAE